MRLISSLNKLFLSILLIILFLLFTSNNALASNIFEENFDNYPQGAFPDRWQKINLFNTPECPQDWYVDNKKLRISINNYYCVTNIIPKDTEWVVNSEEYIFESEVTFVKGVDHNIIYKVNPEGTFFNELHFASPGDFDLNFSYPVNYITNIPGSYPNGETYKFKIIVLEKQIQVYIDNILVRDIITTQKFPSGRIGLRAGTGAVRFTEALFDNIKVSPIYDDLKVPYFSQNDDLWGQEEYDRASEWKPSVSDTSIGAWGCALTSAVMILKYHGYDYLPDGTELNPSSFNTWLLNQPDGFIRNGLVSWDAIKRFSMQAKEINDIDFKALDFEWLERDDETLKENLENEIPTILEVQSSPGSSHFVVANGIKNDKFSINDPFDINATSLSSYSNSYKSMRIFRPSYTDLSSILLVVNEEVELEVNHENDTGLEFMANIFPIKSDTGEETSGANLNSYYIHDPENGLYTFTLSSNDKHKFEADIYLYDKSGTVKMKTFNGVLTANSNDKLYIEFDKLDSENSRINRKRALGINLDTLKNEIKPKSPFR